MAVTGCVSYALCGQIQRLSLKTHRRVSFRASRCLTLCTAGARPEHAPKEVVGRAQSRLQTLLAGCGCQALACRGSCVFLTSLCFSFVWDVSVVLCLAFVGGCPGRAGNLLFRPCVSDSLKRLCCAAFLLVATPSWQASSKHDCCVHRDGEEELVMSMFSEKPAETKLLLTLLTFGVTIGGSFGVCWLTGSDPLGESLSATHPCPPLKFTMSPCVWRKIVGLRF